MKPRINRRRQRSVIFFLLTCSIFLFPPERLLSLSMRVKTNPGGDSRKMLPGGETTPKPVLAGPSLSPDLSGWPASPFPGAKPRPWSSYLSGESSERKDPRMVPVAFLSFSRPEFFCPENQPPLLTGWLAGEGIRIGKSVSPESLSWFQTTPAERQGEKETDETSQEKEEKRQLLRPGFRNIKERVSVYAFVAWIWLVIAVFLYVLNEQVKEADRRHRFKL
ncbi:MAG: hypothetical protein ACUVWQ_10030 [Candidatus Aminicenantales bacterium]